MSYSAYKLKSKSKIIPKPSIIVPFSNETSIPYFDNMLDNPQYFKEEKGVDFVIVQMPPENYIRLLRQSRPHINPTLLVNQSLVNEYADKMKSGTKFPMIYIEYEFRENKTIYRGQEGRHRALAAQKAGVKSIPVLIVFPVEKAPEFLLTD